MYEVMGITLYFLETILEAIAREIERETGDAKAAEIVRAYKPYK